MNLEEVKEKDAKACNHCFKAFIQIYYKKTV